MKTGIIFPAYGDDVVYSGNAGWAPDYPLQNVSDTIRTSKIARRLTAENVEISGDLGVTRNVCAVALIGHNLRPNAVVTLSFYDGSVAGGFGNYLTGAGMTSPTGGHPVVDGLRRVFPLVTAPVAARSFYMTLSNLTEPLELEAIEVGDIWEWPGISYGREMGVSSDTEEVALAGGAAFYPEGGAQRTVTGQVDLMAMAETSTTGLDFQKGLDLDRPFVWAEDFDDPATWARKCLFARNVDLPPMVGALYRHDRFPIRMIEHMR